MSEYEPGTVAVVTLDAESVTRFLADSPVYGRVWWGPKGYLRDCDVTDVRPLVVLDPEQITGPEETGGEEWAASEIAKCLRRLADEDHPTSYRRKVAERIADAIEAQTRPPKPDEPQGLGAVVEDRSGVQWVRIPKDGNEALSEWISYHSTCHTWDAIDAVTVLSEGVAQ